MLSSNVHNSRRLAVERAVKASEIRKDAERRARLYDIPLSTALAAARKG